MDCFIIKLIAYRGVCVPSEILAGTLPTPLEKEQPWCPEIGRGGGGDQWSGHSGPGRVTAVLARVTLGYLCGGQIREPLSAVQLTTHPEKPATNPPAAGGIFPLQALTQKGPGGSRPGLLAFSSGFPPGGEAGRRAGEPPGPRQERRGRREVT